MPKPTPKNRKTIIEKPHLTSRLLGTLQKKELNAVNTYSLFSVNATIVTAVILWSYPQSPDVVNFWGNNISTEMIKFILVAVLSLVSFMLCAIALYKTPGLFAKLFLAVTLIIAVGTAGLNMLGHLWVGGFEHYRFVAVKQPDLDSSALKDARYAVKERQNMTISELSTKLDLVLLDSGHIDRCVQGFEGGLGKPGTGYAYKCIYRTNRYVGIKRDFPGAIRDINYELLKKDWRAGEVFYVLDEYENRTKDGDIKNVVNSLPGLIYYKNKQMLEIDYADLDLAKQDESYPVELAIGDISQIISGGDNGIAIHEDEKIVESVAAVRKAKTQSLQYVIVLSSEEEYFINY